MRSERSFLKKVPESCIADNATQIHRSYWGLLGFPISHPQKDLIFEKPLHSHKATIKSQFSLSFGVMGPFFEYLLVFRSVFAHKSLSRSSSPTRLRSAEKPRFTPWTKGKCSPILSHRTFQFNKITSRPRPRPHLRLMTPWLHIECIMLHTQHIGDIKK